MKGLTFKYIPRDVFGNFQREITLGLYPQNTTINDGTILGLISSDIYGQDAVAVENSSYYLFSDIPPNKYVLIKSGAGVRTEILETALDIPYSGKSTGSDIVWKDNESESIATKINALENLIIATPGYKNYSALELTALIGASGLVPGQKYRITDYQTVYDDGSVHAGNVEPLLVFAISNNQLSPEAFSETFPKDIIYYESNNDGTEIYTTGSTKGYIYQRIDTKSYINLRFDFRTIGYAEFTVVTTDAEQSISGYWDDSSYFPQYIPSEWNDDYNAFLSSLGDFRIDYGDGTIEDISFTTQEYSHTYLSAKTYKLKIYSKYVFANSEYVNSVDSLTSLQSLYLYNCTGLTTPPTLTGLTNLQTLYLNNCTGLTTPPTLTGLTSLQSLNLDGCTGLTTPPTLTGLTSLQSLYLYNCTGLTTPPTLTGLTSLKNLYLYDCKLITTGVDEVLTTLTDVSYSSIANVDLRMIPPATPTPSVKSAFISAHPTCNLQTN